MIAAVRGVVEARGTDWVVLTVGGISLRIAGPASSLARIGAPGDTVRLHTHLAVREDNLSLYGFPTEEELQLFQVLLTVSGIGPRNALGILSALPPDQLVGALASGNVDLLTKVPGIGKKTAARIVLELRGKLALPTGEVPGVPPIPLGVNAEVVEALTALGYSLGEASTAVSQIEVQPDTPIEERLRLALQKLARRRDRP